MLRDTAILFSLIALCPAIALADPPPDVFDIDFSGDAAIWNPFGDFEACESVLGATLCLALTDVECDGKGKCAGDATWTFTGAVSGEVSGTFTAAAKCKAPRKAGGDVCKAQISSCDTDGQVSGFDATIDGCKIKGPVLANGLFEGFGRVRICLLGAVQPGKLFCQSGTGAFEYGVNPPVPWTLSMDISTDAKGSISGTASGLGLNYDVKGKYKDCDGSKLTMKGMKGDKSKGASIKIKDLVVNGSTVVSGEAKIKVLGNQASVELD